LEAHSTKEGRIKFTHEETIEEPTNIEESLVTHEETSGKALEVKKPMD
jgi:hypothetical protein